MKNSDNSAFPISEVDSDQTGLTKREYFAGLAMQGMLAANDTYSTPEMIARRSLEYADMLLRGLNHKA